MTAATFLTGLYPPAVRDRWGADLHDEVAGSGIASWPDTLAGAIRLWMHPSDWPESVTGENRRVVTVMLFTIMAATALLLRTVDPTATLTADVHHPVTSLWLLPLLIGMVLAAPLPRNGPGALRRLATTAAHTMAAPAVAVLAVFLLAWSGLAQQLAGVAATAALAFYWITLGFAALRSCVFVSRAARSLGLPSTRRLSIALLLIGTGLALAAGQDMATLTRSGFQATPVAQTLALGLLAASALSAGQDLYAAR